MNNLYLKQEDCIGLPQFYKLYRKVFEHANGADPCVAWALMRIYYPKKDSDFYMNADLMMIYTHEPGSGYGLELMRRLQTQFPVIRTSWSGSTKEGRALCLKADFVREEDMLIWKKEKDGPSESQPRPADS